MSQHLEQLLKLKVSHAQITRELYHARKKLASYDRKASEVQTGIVKLQQAVASYQYDLREARKELEELRNNPVVAAALDGFKVSGGAFQVVEG